MQVIFYHFKALCEANRKMWIATLFVQVCGLNFIFNKCTILWFFSYAQIHNIKFYTCEVQIMGSKSIALMYFFFLYPLGIGKAQG